MKQKIKYSTIFNYRLKEFSDSVDKKNANSGVIRALFIIIPFLFLFVFFEFIWIKIFDGDLNKYTLFIY